MAASASSRSSPGRGWFGWLGGGGGNSDGSSCEQLAAGPNELLLTDSGDLVEEADQPTPCCFGGRAGPSSSRQRASRNQRCERVLVHVYDLGDSFLTRSVWNSVAKSYGAFHSGVEVYGREWIFGMPVEGEDEDDTGITWHLPRENLDHSFRETLSMGFTTFSSHQVLEIVEEMKSQWKGSRYNMLTRNCHDFSNDFCLRLGVTGLPSWVNSLAPTGAKTYEFFDNTDSGYDGGEGLFELFETFRSGMYSGLGWDTKPTARHAAHY